MIDRWVKEFNAWSLSGGDSGLAKGPRHSNEGKRMERN